MRRKRLLPDPDGPVMAAHAPVPRFSSNGPANALRRFLTRSAVAIELPSLQWPRLCCEFSRTRSQDYTNFRHRGFCRIWPLAESPANAQG